jgi:hypothetical protein
MPPPAPSGVAFGGIYARTSQSSIVDLVGGTHRSGAEHAKLLARREAEKHRNFVDYRLVALLHRQILPHHDHATILTASHQPVLELGHVLRPRAYLLMPPVCTTYSAVFGNDTTSG